MGTSTQLAVVLGATGGVGTAVSRRLASIGFDLLISGRDRVRLHSFAAELTRATARRIEVDSGEFTSAADVARVSESCDHLGSPTCLVNCAGTFGPVGYPESVVPAQWEAVMGLNATSPIALACRLLPGMLHSDFGRIIMISSAHTLHPADAITSPYFTSKSALNAGTRALAARLEGTNVAAVLIHPGDIKTAMWSDIDAQVAQVEQLEHEAGRLREWVDRVGVSGGDDPADAAALVEDVIKRDATWSNGEFMFAGSSAERHPQR